MYSDVMASLLTSVTSGFVDGTGNSHGLDDVTRYPYGLDDVTGNPMEGFPYPSLYSWVHIALASITVTIIMAIIVVGNALVVVSICVDRNLKGVQNWFIASLAISDLLVGLFIMPLSLANELMGYWAFGDVLCQLWLSTDVLLCTASILNLCLISLDRYWSITRAVAYVRQRTTNRAILMISIVWILSMIICLPPLVGWKRPQEETKYGYKLCLLSEEPGYVIYSIVGSFYVPLIVMISVYLKIYIAARSRARRSLSRSYNNKPSEMELDDARTTFTTLRNRAPEAEKLSRLISNPNECSVLAAKDVGKLVARDISAIVISTNVENVNKVDSTLSNALPRSNNRAAAVDQHEGLAPSKRTTNVSEVIITDVGTSSASSGARSESANITALAPTPDACRSCNGAVDLLSPRGDSSCSTALLSSKLTFTSDDSGSPVSGDNESVFRNDDPTELESEIELARSPGNQNDCSENLEIPLLVRNSQTANVDPRLDEDETPSGANRKRDNFEVVRGMRRWKRCSDGDASRHRRSLLILLSSGQRRLSQSMKFRARPPSSNALQESEKAKRRLARARERRATVVLGIVMASFVGCWLPFFSIYPITSVTGLEIPSGVFSVIFWLGYCNSALNPIIYTIFNREFRQAFQKLLCIRRKQNFWV